MSLPARTAERVDLPEPLGPMMAWVSPSRIVRSMPRSISLSYLLVAYIGMQALDVE